MSKIKSFKSTSASLPVKFDKADEYAIQALARGDATPEQQRRALRSIVEKAAGAYEVSYRAESDRETCFAEGRRFVGLQIIKAYKINIERVDELANQKK